MKQITAIIRMLICVALLGIALMPAFTTTLTGFFALLAPAALSAAVLMNRIKVWDFSCIFEGLFTNSTDEFL
jgi:hypothetical protein